jgi:hypothetical protein
VKLCENKTIHNSASTDRRDKTGRRRTVLRSDTRELLTKNFPTLILILAICNFQFRLLRALAVSGAIFLELDQPFAGLIRISSEPMVNALSQLAG